MKDTPIAGRYTASYALSEAFPSSRALLPEAHTSLSPIGHDAPCLRTVATIEPATMPRPTTPNLVNH